MNYITEHQIWYEIVTYGLRDIFAKFKSTTFSAHMTVTYGLRGIFAKFKSTTLSVYRDIYI